MWVAPLPVKMVFGFAAVFICMEIGALLLEPMLRMLAGQAAAAAHWFSPRLITGYIPCARLPGGYVLELATSPHLICSSFTPSLSFLTSKKGIIIPTQIT